jgi:hypothetical protein
VPFGPPLVDLSLISAGQDAEFGLHFRATRDDFLAGIGEPEGQASFLGKQIGRVVGESHELGHALVTGVFRHEARTSSPAYRNRRDLNNVLASADDG